MVAHGDGQPDTAAAARLRRDLQDSASQSHGIVAGDHALFLVTENRVEIDGAEGHKGTRRIAWRAGERGVVLRHEAIREIAVRRLERRNPGDAELIDEPILESPIEALTSA